MRQNLKRRRRKYKASGFLMLFAFISVITLIIVLITTGKQDKPLVKPVDNEISNNTTSKVNKEEKSVSDETTTARIIGIGDNILHSNVMRSAKKNAQGSGYDFGPTYEAMEDLIKSADIASINQETPIAPEFDVSGYPVFNSPKQIGNHLLEIGFDVFNQASNHSMDIGESGLLSTLNYWATKPSAIVTGAYKNEEDAEAFRVITRNNITFSFIGMTEISNLPFPSKDSGLVLMRTADEIKIRERIVKAKSVSDVVVVNVHWGVEYTHKPNEIQKELANKMIDWGADIILGHHPHVIQPVEYIERADGTKGIVCYSLGNFISTQEYGPRMIGGALDVSVSKNQETGVTSISNVRFIPTVTHYGEDYSDVRVYPLQKYTKELANSHGVKERTKEFSYDYIQNLVHEVIDEKFLTPYQ